MSSESGSGEADAGPEDAPAPPADATPADATPADATPDDAPPVEGLPVDGLPDPPIMPRLHGEGVWPVRDVLPGIETLAAFKEITGSLDPDELLAEAHILCFKGEGYPRVDDHTGHILCPDEYMRDHEPLIVYLDILHELVHVRQVLQGERVYHFPLPYVDWPTEIEAYRIGWNEAQRLGIDPRWFWRYLAVPWVEDGELERLGRAIGLISEDGQGPHIEDDDEEGARH